jgi:hypothetical protein
MRSPAGGLVEVPQLATVTDELALWNTTPKATCFSLATLGPNAHDCGAWGVAERAALDVYIFTREGCTLRLRQLRGGQVRIDSRDCPRGYGGCATSGRIDSATYRPLRQPPSPSALRPEYSRAR